MRQLKIKIDNQNEMRIKRISEIDISNYTKVSKEQEISIIEAIKYTEEREINYDYIKNVNKLLAIYTPLIIETIKKYADKGIRFKDLLDNYGFHALMEAVDSYDLNSDYDFRKYAKEFLEEKFKTEIPSQLEFEENFEVSTNLEFVFFEYEKIKSYLKKNYLKVSSESILPISFKELFLIRKKLESTEITDEYKDFYDYLLRYSAILYIIIDDFESATRILKKLETSEFSESRKFAKEQLDKINYIKENIN